VILSGGGNHRDFNQETGSVSSVSQERPFLRIRLELSGAFAGVALGSSALWIGAINLHRNAIESYVLVAFGAACAALSILFGLRIAGQLTQRLKALQHALGSLDAERNKVAKALSESERRFRDIFGNVSLVSLMLDLEGRITYCNDYLLRLTGRPREAVLGHNWFELFVPADTPTPRKAFAALLANHPQASQQESEILTSSGERRLVRWSNSVLRSVTGNVIGAASIGEDITEQNRTETKIKRLNRVHALLSGTNAAIARIRERTELFHEVCRVANRAGQFAYAWVGTVDGNAMLVKPLACYGSGEGVEQLDADRFSFGEDIAAGQSIVADAVRTKKTVISNDVLKDVRTADTARYAAQQVRSVAILPLLAGNEVVGVLALHSSEVDFFDEDEKKLLLELAGDISFALEYIESAQKLDYLAYFDVLTGLANRTLFVDRLAQYVRAAADHSHKLALFLLDLERFKNINDSLGRPAGDALLKQVAQWLLRDVGDPMLLARLGADLFAIVLPEVKKDGNLPHLLDEWYRQFVDYPFQLNDAECHIAAKIGVALYPDDGADADTLCKNAEAALKKAKIGGDRYLFYTQTMTETVIGRLTLEYRLRQALDNGEFVLHYQPKVRLANGKVTSAEALIRWNDPQSGLVAPGRFIPILEQTGMIHDVGRWALRQAIGDYLRWCDMGLDAVRVAVNVSPLQLRDRRFIIDVKQAIGIDARAAAGLELEITESLIMENVNHSIASLQAIRDLGVTVAIDDFGTGFSSLSYLSKLPIDTLKIDRSFVIDMTSGPQGLALVSTIITLAHSLKLKVVAEGVETEEQRRLLRSLKCDEMQGYLYSKPIPRDAFESDFLTLRVTT
jgi:diguanylate cyclase (GGDEF)-like protein/PAS domain S-box-containing protein